MVKPTVACRQPYLTLWTYKATHIFHNAYDWQFHFMAEVDLLSNILKRYFLQTLGNTAIVTFGC